MSALWEAEAGGSQSQVFETSLANTGLYLLKIQKLTGVVVRAFSPSYSGG